MIGLATLLTAFLSLIAAASSRTLTKDEIIQKTLKVRRLPIDICGKSSEKVFEKKIINGDPAELGAYPWMAAIGYFQNDVGPYWKCGGSLITDQYVLTAAHCLDPKKLSSPRISLQVSLVRLGELDLNDSIADGATPLDVQVESTVFHELYDNDKKNNDIGLVKLKDKVQYTDLIKPICLPPPEFRSNNFEGYMAVVAGWGATKLGRQAEYNTHLQEAEVELQNLDSCRSNITSVLRSVVIDENVICARSPGKDSCQGDSGGPLMLYRRYNGRSRMFLLGVVSYGFHCAEINYPGVYSRVSQFMPWIIDNLDI